MKTNHLKLFYIELCAAIILKCQTSYCYQYVHCSHENEPIIHAFNEFTRFSKFLTSKRQNESFFFLTRVD